MMRIITGKAKGIKLKTLEGVQTRPTAERVKEAIFSSLQFDIENRHILDLFSGSGQMGLEALSRGAATATMIDKSYEAIKIIKENAEKTKLKNQCNIYNTDALDFLQRNKNQKFDIIFLDPPYESKLYAPILNQIYDHNIIKESSIIICESNYDFFDEKLNSKFEITKRAQYGKIIITTLKPILKTQEI